MDLINDSHIFSFSRTSNPKRSHTAHSGLGNRCHIQFEKHHRLIDVNTKNSSKDSFKIRKSSKSRAYIVTCHKINFE